jgi:CHAT domain-containing protein
MNQLPTQPTTSSDEQFAEKLITFSQSEEFIRMLQYRRGHLNPLVIRRLKDEVAHLIRVDINRAVKLAEVTRAAATLTSDPICEALAHHAYAMAMHFSGHYGDALRFYQQAEAIYAQHGEQVEAARIGRAKVDALMYLGRYDEALQVADEARLIFERHDQVTLLAQLETNVGNIYHRLDRYREALTFYELAEKTFLTQQDEFGLAMARMNAAHQHTQLNEFEKALDLYRLAQQGYERLNMPLLVNQTEYSIAWLYFLRGRFQESLKLFARVQARFRDLGEPKLDALCDLDQAEVYLQLNTYEDGILSAQAAAEKFHRLKLNYEYAKAKLYLGIAHTHLNDLAAAELELEEAKRCFMAEGNEVYTALSDVYLSDVLTYRQEWPQAEQLCAEAEKIFGEQKLPAKVAYVELQLARLKLFLHDREGSESLCRSALEMIGEVEAPWLKYQCLHLLGQLTEQAGQEQEAYEYYAKAIEYLETLRSSIRVDEFKCTFLKDKLRVYEDMVDLCLRAGTEEKLEEAFSYTQAAKSRSLVELLAADRSITSKLKEPSVEQLHHEWNRLREELDWYYNQINRYESRNHQRPAWLGVELHTEVREREQRLARLARRLRLSDSEYASLHATPRLDLSEVRHCVAEDEALIEYYLINGRVKVFALNRDEVRVFNDITTADETMPLLRWLKFYMDQFIVSERHTQVHLNKVEMLTRQYLEKLYTALIKPIESFLDGKKIIFAPQDFLHYVPFHALHDGEAHLIDRHEISYCPSASVYTLCAEKARQRPANGRVLVMGVPDEATPFIREEVKTVASLWNDANVLLGEEATLEKLKEQALDCRLLHLASHGVFRRDNPMFSALKLSDSWLNFYDIFNLSLNADLVTLSACETGMNEIFPGDELFGLMRGFLYAGVPSLIVSLWMVNDRSTAEFMRSLYAGLKEGLSKRAAIRHAQLAVKQEYRHPYYWAPFILMGAPA